VQHLNAVVSTPALRDAYHANLPKITAFFADLAQDARLFNRYRALSESTRSTHSTARSSAQIANELRDFRLGGVDLAPPQKARFKAVEEELAELSARFDDNLLDATNGWAMYVDDEAELSGVPPEVRAEARAAAASEGKTGWKLTLRTPCYLR
jgi:oligopeptidase A